jgi:hypothetical protein
LPPGGAADDAPDAASAAVPERPPDAGAPEPPRTASPQPCLDVVVSPEDTITPPPPPRPQVCLSRKPDGEPDDDVG